VSIFGVAALIASAGGSLADDFTGHYCGTDESGMAITVDIAAAQLSVNKVVYPKTADGYGRKGDNLDEAIKLTRKDADTIAMVYTQTYTSTKETYDTDADLKTCP
jgi:hypothetical protein